MPLKIRLAYGAQNLIVTAQLHEFIRNSTPYFVRGEDPR